MTAVATVVWVLNLICVTIGHLSLKAAAAAAPDASFWTRWTAMLKDPWMWLGTAAFVVEFLLWLAFLSLVPLSLAVLMGSLDTFVVAVGGRIFFAEPLTPRRIVSTGMIVIGVALVGWG
jgi:undecaprenyl phosphate-alpha-L-ara4N flippase subunit ArnE